MLTDTTRKMASIQCIDTLTPIPNSDFLEVATMKNLGWKVVVKKGEFQVGDKVVYFEIDSAIDVKDLIEPMKFLAEKGARKLFTGKTPETSAFSGEYVRIKTIKLRGQISQGLVISLKSFIDILPIGPDIRFPVGMDLTKDFNVEVWDRLQEWYADRSQLGPRAGMHPASNFPDDVPKTDEVRIQSAYSDLIKDEANVNGEWEITEKNDGSSCTLFYRPVKWEDDPMKIASRRFVLKDDGGSDDWFDAFKRHGWDNLKVLLQNIYDMGIAKARGEYLLPPRHEIAIQGEMIGPKFNGNRDRNKESHFRVFRIFDITEQKFVTPETRYAICNLLGLEHVKVIEKSCKVFERFKSVDDFVEFADGKTDNGFPREGVVFKRVDDGSVSFKAVSNKYLLKQED